MLGFGLSLFNRAVAAGGTPFNTIATARTGNVSNDAPDEYEKVSGGAGLNASVRGIVGLTGSCSLRVSLISPGAVLVIGVSTNPAANDSYSSIERGFWLNGDATLHSMEGGEPVAISPTANWTTGDELGVDISGTTASLLLNEVEVHSVAVTAGQTWYIDSTLYYEATRFKLTKWASA